MPGFLRQGCLLIHLLKQRVICFFLAELDGYLVGGLGLSGQGSHISIVDYLADLEVISVELDAQKVFVGLVDLLHQG